MKSRLFKNSENFKDSFNMESMKEDLAAMLSIGSDKIVAFADSVGEILNSSVTEREQITEKALPGVGVERGIFDSACNAAGWLATEFFPNGSAKRDKPEDIADDMITLSMIPEGQRAACAAFISGIKFMVQQEMWSAIEKDRALQTGAPKVVGVETALFFRNVFRKGP